MTHWKNFISALFGILLIISASGQTFGPGIPPSLMISGSDIKTQNLSYPNPDLTPLRLEDAENEAMGFPNPERVAVGIPVEIDPATHGIWTTLDDGSKIWRVTLHCAGAIGLGMNVNPLYIPEGGELYFYNADGSSVYGALTFESNTPTGAFSSDYVQGDVLNVEYFEPAGAAGGFTFKGLELIYGYRLIYFKDDRGGSWPCMINVACEEGDNWQDQIKGIVKLDIKIGYYYYLCSGSLINNTSHNRVPYVLTAAHCGEGASANDLLYWKFYFNYQSATCNGTYGPSNQVLSGCTFKAKDPSFADAGSDFYLVQINASIPATYNAYFNGWNRTNVPAADTGVGIHHPAGDIKKISTHYNMTSSTWWNGLPSHWRILWAQTVNGRSIMQGGSSGSPVFDEDGLILGDLTGGYASNSCSNPSPAWYGKIWYSWDQNGSTNDTRLKPWLDPGDTGEEKIPGLFQAVMPPVVDFEADQTTVNQGDSVHFTDMSTGNPALEWEWTFEGGDPDTSTEQNPAVYYTITGTFDVTLTVTNADGTNTETKADYITVNQIAAPTPDFESDTTIITEGQTIDFYDLSTGFPSAWTWIFEGGSPDTSYVQNPEAVQYELPGTYDVTLTAANYGGNNTITKSDYITVNAGVPPVSDFMADVTEINVGDTVNFTDLSSGNPTKWIWTFDGGSPGSSGQKNPQGIVYNEAGAFNVQLYVKNAYGNNTTVKEDYIVVGYVTVKDINKASKNYLVYPNPSNGVVYVKARQEMPKGSVVRIMDSKGNIIDNLTVSDQISDITLDLTQHPSGLYHLVIVSGSTISEHKISLIK